MKKITILSFVFISILTAKAQDFVEFTASESTIPKYELITSNDTLVKFNVIVPGMFETTIDTFNRVNIKGHTKMDSIGFPEMPIVSFLVAIPDCDSVSLNIKIMDSTQFSGYNIYPAPELVPDTLAGGAIALIEQFSYKIERQNTFLLILKNT